MNIQPQYLSLIDLLKGRLFSIPEYQRAYSWTARERGDLYADIKKTFNKGGDADHYLAAVVCVRRGKQMLGTTEYKKLEIVDGQQRMTTLTVLLKAIQLELKLGDKKDQRVATELGELLVKPDGDELLLLQTNHDTSHHFANYMRSGNAPASESARTIADRQILSAIEESATFIEEWRLENGPLIPLVALIKNRLHLLLHEIDDEKSVYTVFEVLNSRGLDVSWLDRLKSVLMGAAFDLDGVNKSGLIKDLHVKWQNIYSVIGLRQGLSTEALRFAATLTVNDCPNRPLSEKDAVDHFRSCAFDAKSIRYYASWLLEVVNACDRVTANPRINAVTRIAQARLVAVAIHLRSDLTSTQRAALLSLWEKVTFRIYGLHNYDARTGVGDYVRLAWSIVREELKPAVISKSLTSIGKSFPITEAIDRMRVANCYEGWQQELRYFMFRYEEYLATKAGQKFENEQWQRIWLASPSDSIEHILPQSTAPQKSKHRLGNLVLLPPRLNSKLQDRRPEGKSDDYRKTGLFVAVEVASLIDIKKWNSKAIEERGEALLKWAAVEWGDAV